MAVHRTPGTPRGITVKTEIVDLDLGLALRHPRHARKWPRGRLPDEIEKSSGDASNVDQRVDIDLTQVDDHDILNTLLAEVRTVAARVTALEAIAKKATCGCGCSCANVSATTTKALTALEAPIHDASLRVQVSTLLTQISTILQADQNRSDAADNVGAYAGTPSHQHNLKRTDASVESVSSLNTASLAPEHSISSGDFVSPVPDPPSRPPATSMAVDPGPVRSLALESPSVTKSKSKATSAGAFSLLGLASPTSTALPSPRSTPGPVTAPGKPLFLRTPFDTRLTYATLADHPQWFLDRADFAPDGPALPRALCPRGEGEVCHGDEKGKYEGKSGQEEFNEGTRLRCPFCRKSMTGGAGEDKDVRARWASHVVEQHGVTVEGEGAELKANKEKEKEKGHDKEKEKEKEKESEALDEPAPPRRARGSMSLEDMLAPTPASHGEPLCRAHTHTLPNAQESPTPVRRAETMHAPHQMLQYPHPYTSARKADHRERDEPSRKRRRIQPHEPLSKHESTSASAGLRIRLPATRPIHRADGGGVGVDVRV